MDERTVRGGGCEERMDVGQVAVYTEGGTRWQEVSNISAVAPDEARLGPKTCN